MRSTKRLLLCRRKERYACGEFLKVEDDLYFGGAGDYFGKHPGGRQSSHRMLFKNGEAIEIDPECTSVYALAVSSETNALHETEKSPMVVFPNPAMDRATLEGIEPAEIQIYNLQGQSVRIFSDTNEIDVSGLPKGIYLLQITDKAGLTHSTKLVVE